AWTAVCPMVSRSTAATPRAGCSRPSNTAIPSTPPHLTRCWTLWSRWSWPSRRQRTRTTRTSSRRMTPMNNLNDIFFAPAANQDLTYDQVLEDVQRYFAENHASTIAEAGEGNAE